MTTDERLAKLEGQHRWLKLSCGVLAALLVAILLMGQSKEAKKPSETDYQKMLVEFYQEAARQEAEIMEREAQRKHELKMKEMELQAKAGIARAEKIEAKQYVLIDENGKVCARLGIFKGGPSLMMLDQAGKPRIWLFVGDKGPTIRAYDEKTRPVWSAP